jgi:hypothetical protein
MLEGFYPASLIIGEKLFLLTFSSSGYSVKYAIFESYSKLYSNDGINSVNSLSTTVNKNLI